VTLRKNELSLVTAQHTQTLALGLALMTVQAEHCQEEVEEEGRGLLSSSSEERRLMCIFPSEARGAASLMRLWSMLSR